MAHHSIRVLAAGLIAALVMVASPAGTHAKLPSGGWAITSLDDVPELVAGESADVGFTVRQHGRHPVEGDIGEVGIVVSVLSGERSWEYPSGGRFFPAARTDRPGHFVASVTVPDAGTYAWHVRQGWFGAHDLGELVVAPPSPGAASWPNSARPALAGLAALLGVGAVVGARRWTGRRSAEPGAVVTG